MGSRLRAKRKLAAVAIALLLLLVPLLFQNCQNPAFENRLLENADSTLLAAPETSSTPATSSASAPEVTPILAPVTESVTPIPTPAKTVAVDPEAQSASVAKIISGEPLQGFYTYSHILQGNSSITSNMFLRQKPFANVITLIPDDPRFLDRMAEAKKNDMTFIISIGGLVFDTAGWDKPTVPFESRFKSRGARINEFRQLKERIRPYMSHFLGAYTEEIFWHASSMPGQTNAQVIARFNTLSTDVGDIGQAFSTVFPDRIIMMADAYPIFSGYLASGARCIECVAHIHFFGIHWVGFEGAYAQKTNAGDFCSMASCYGETWKTHFTNFLSVVASGQKVFIAPPAIDLVSDRRNATERQIDADNVNQEIFSHYHGLVTPAQRAGVLFYHWQDLPIPNLHELGLGSGERDSQHLTNALLFNSSKSLPIHSMPSTKLDPATWSWGDREWKSVPFGVANNPNGIAMINGNDRYFIHPLTTGPTRAMIRASIPINASKLSVFRDAYFVARFQYAGTCGDGVVVQMHCEEAGEWKSKVILNFSLPSPAPTIRPPSDMVVRLPVTFAAPTARCELWVDPNADPHCDHVYMSNPRLVSW